MFADRHRPLRANRPAPGFEPLEGRALLSGLAYAGRGAAAEIAAQSRSDGVVHKRPAFYEFYTGPRRADLDVVSGSAVLKSGRTLTLTGTMKGAIARHPGAESQEGYYVFGIDRRSPKAVTPFFQRPGISFDAVVVVSVEVEGVTAAVTDLATGARTTIDPKSVHIAGKTVSVALPGSLLPTPPGGVDLAHATFNLWPRSSLDNTPQPDHGSFVASFLPENATAPIHVVGRGRG